MKKIFFLLASIISLPLFAQTTMEKTTKKIEVTGFAEIEVVPDELYFSISLREYFKDEKNQKDKISIDGLEKQLIKAVEKAGLSKESLSIGSVQGYRNWTGKRKPQLFLESKQYILKLSNLYKIDGIMSEIDERGIEYANMQRTEHSKIVEIRKEVKQKALQAAKDKANYLLESINEHLGEVLEIKELDEQYYQPVYAANMRMMAMADASPVEDSNLEHQKIKISYKMMAVFRIK